MKLNILGVTIDNVSKSETLKRVQSFVDSDNSHYIVTINPEFVIAARRDDEFRHILNHADLSVADGFGLVLAARRQGKKLATRITGVDLLMDICRLASEQGKSVFLLGSKRHVPEQAARELVKQYPALKIAGAETGYRRWHRPIKDKKIVRMINRKKPDILFVAFGQVRQEKWIYRNLPKLKTVRVAMGVGGSFDYISGQVRRAPRPMRSMGLEWLYRVMRQPWRLPRIITAVIKFGWLAVIRKP